MLLPKPQPIRDREWLDFLKTQPCLITGRPPTENDPVDPMHIGTRGKGVKSSDDEVLPVLHSLHRRGHDSGEISMIREMAPDWLLREMARAYARQLFREWKEKQ